MSRDHHSSLTNREAEIALWLLLGYTTKEVGLTCSPEIMPLVS